MARPELAAFLRARRARVRPADVGLPAGARRRTPGLRREEVAQLADVGASWYTWLEQGRDIHASEAFLERLAHALRLGPTERTHLSELAQGRSPRRPESGPDAVSAMLQRLIDAQPFPAMVTTPRYDIVAWNEPASRVFGTVEKRNGLRSMFADPERRKRPGWETYARVMVARFRLDAARASNRAEFDALAAELSALSPEFVVFWSEHDVAEWVEGVKIIHHAAVGTIEMEHVTLLHAEPDGRTLRITNYLPRPGVSTERLAKLLAQPVPIEQPRARLRAVTR